MALAIRNEDRWPSPFNAPGLERLRTAFPINVPPAVRVSDCTLRDGEQQAGLSFDRAAKVRVAQALESLGVYEIEAGTPASSQEDADAIAEIVGLGLNAKISVLVRSRRDDIDQARSLGVWGVRISFPISPLQRQHKLKGIDDEEYLRQVLEITDYAKSQGLYVIFSPFDTTRADLNFACRVVRELARTQTADRIRVVDTTGCATPEGIMYLVGALKDSAPEMAFEIHVHNDFGLACINTVAGVLAGAEYVSTTMNGIGERSGNAATEEVAMTLEALYGVETGLRLERLTEVSQIVQRESGVRLQPHKAVVGENSFRHEAGMVVSGVVKEPYTAESYRPHVVGQRRQLVVGKKSGLAAIKAKLAELDLSAPEEKLPDLVQRVKEQAIRQGRALTDDEFRALVQAAAS